VEIIRSAATSFASHVHITKQGTPKFITEVHYILATISLKFRAQITKFQGDVPEALKHGISLVRLAICTDHAKLAAAERIQALARVFEKSSL
jgi:hypothetical protein